MILVNVGRGAFALIGAKSDPKFIGLYDDYIRRCPSNCIEFVDACIGAGNITSRMMGRFQSYIANDADPMVATIFYGLSKYNREVFLKALELDEVINNLDSVNYHKNLDDPKKIWDSIDNLELDYIIEKAATYLLMKNKSFNGIGMGFSGNRTSICKRRKSLEMFMDLDKIYSMDLLDLLNMLYADGDNINDKRFLFLDPAYLDANVAYNNKSIYTKNDYHKKLCRSARRFKNVLICGYESELYKQELEDFGFYKTLIGTKAVTAGSKSNIRAKEFIWTSYKI